MSSFETTCLIEGYRDRCEDRVEIMTEGDRTVIVVSDGAGGTGDGHLAAQTVIRETRANYSAIASSTGWSQFLSQLDFRISSGESTAVIVDLYPDRILGASVGDSSAWIINSSDVTDLTRTQVRKPLLGSQAAKPAPFWHGALDGVLLVGTDGFFNHVKHDQVTAMISRTDFFAIPRACIDMVRLGSGELWDDTAVAICRVHRLRAPRKRFTI